MRETQPEVLPATSTTLVSSVCSPWPVTVTVPDVAIDDAGDAVELLLDARHAGAGRASVPLTVTSSESARQPRGGTVVSSSGRIVSIRTTCVVQPVTWPRRR